MVPLMHYNDKKGKGFLGRIRATFQKRSTPTPPQFGGTLAPTYGYDPTLSANGALTISAVYRAVSIVAGHVKQLPLDVYRGNKTIDVPALVAKPDVTSTQSAFKEQTAVSLALSGNAYWRLYRDSPTGAVQSIQVLNPHNVLIEQDLNTGRLTYRYHDDLGDYTFAEWQIKHLALMRVPGSLYGLGPIQAAQAELCGAVDLRNYATNWFRKGQVPTGVLKTDQVLTPDLATAYRARWEETNGGERGIAVLGNGMSYTPVYLSPDQAQFLESQQFTITQIARMFGIPAGKLLAEVNGNSMTYTNLESATTDFIRDTLTAYLSEIEDALSDLIPRGQVVRFKVDALLRADKETRYTTYKIALDAGFMTIDEVRAEEGLPPMQKQEVPTQ